MITKGIRISQLVERKDLNGKEIIPFQDGIHNGKMSIDSLIDYIGDVSDSDIDLQSLVKIQEFVDTVSEMNTLLYQAKENDIYYCKENKKLYIRRFNEWEIIDPLNSKVYVLVGLDEYNRTNIIHLWDGNDMVVMSERLFLGETTGTAYDSGKGKALADIVSRIIIDGDGTKYLSDDGTYKEVSGGSSSSDINIIELQDIRDIINIVNHEKDAASSDIRSVFGSSANFRAIVNDILKTHTRYFFHVKDTPDTNCIQLSGVNAWKNIDNTQYELHFIYNYYISNGNQRTCRRVTVIDSDNTDSNLFIVENVNDMYVLSKDRDRRKSVSLVGEGFDENHWYPVSFTADPNSIVPPCNLIIWNSLNNDSAGISPKPSWATNNGGFVLHIDMTIIGNGYGQYTYARNKLNNWHGEWGGETAVGEMRQTTQTSTFYIYLRGGANYFYTSDYADLKMTAHSSEVLDGYNTYSIKDTQGNIKDFFVYVENDLFGEVKNLQIVHDNEFNFANDSIGNYVWINYRSRYDSVTSAKAVYVGNGQAGADGAFGAIHASGFFKESDVRLKSNIAPLNHTLDQICNIPTVEFNMHDKHQIGTIAQDLENNFAEIVNTDSDGMKSVDYCMLGVVAIEGVKLLRQEIEDLKKQIQELKNGKQNN